MSNRLYLLSALAGVLLSSAVSEAQRPAGPARIDAPPVGATLDSTVFRDLPAADVFSLMETTQADIVADGFNNGGVNAGVASHLTSFLGSRSQTQFRLGDIDISSPVSGEPLLFPDLALWESVATAAALMSADVNSPSLAISVAPLRPGARWTGTGDGFFSRGPLISERSPGTTAPIVALRELTRGSIAVSGPLGTRHRLAAGVAVMANAVARETKGDPTYQRTGSLFVHDVLTLKPGHELKTLAIVQRVRAPSPHATSSEMSTSRDRAVHVQSTYEVSIGGAKTWRVFGGYTERRRDDEGRPAIRIADRIADGPIEDLLVAGDSVERRWAAGARVAAWERGRHTLSAGADYSGAARRATPTSDAIIGELVDGFFARVWRVAAAAQTSQRHANSLSVFAADRISLSSSLTLEAALSLESATGAATGASTGISWFTALPHATLRWAISPAHGLDLLTGYRRSANQLTLDVLAYGDPAAPTANVFRWEPGATPDAASTLVATAGPGTGGNPAFSRIDPELKRPSGDEFVIALARATQSSRVSVAGLARRESSLINAVNTGAPLSAYRSLSIADPNADLASPSDDQQLTVYDRLPESFGRDRYLLTNTPDEAATAGALVIRGEITTGRLFLAAGATASASVGPGGSRGFHAVENDQDAIGERWTTANASTNARGRLFSDRAYTIKLATVYRLPRAVRVGAIARYQDGQPFSRLVVVPGLAQGADMIQAFPNGRSRFAFTGTLDVRLQKGFVFRSMRLDAIADAYNLLNLSKEVEEDVVTGGSFRTPTAVQPPRALHLGFRVAF